MRYYPVFTAAALMLFVLSSCTKVRNRNMTVIKDCTGTYLRFNEKDYMVCNRDKLASFADDEEVTATFKKIVSCPDWLQGIQCDMYHEYKGWVMVEKIR